jgi:hypothetical protein
VKWPSSQSDLLRHILINLRQATRIKSSLISSLLLLILGFCPEPTPYRLQTSSDGQKFEVRVDSLNANYSVLGRCAFYTLGLQ